MARRKAEIVVVEDEPVVEQVEKPVRHCECGCGQVVSGRSRFGVGHDAKRKSALIRQALDGSAEAVEELEQRGWTKFLDKRREVIAREEARRTKVSRCGRCNRPLTDDQSCAVGLGPDCWKVVQQEQAEGVVEAAD